MKTVLFLFGILILFFPLVFLRETSAQDSSSTLPTMCQTCSSAIGCAEGLFCTPLVTTGNTTIGVCVSQEDRNGLQTCQTNPPPTSPKDFPAEGESCDPLIGCQEDLLCRPAVTTGNSTYGICVPPDDLTHGQPQLSISPLDDTFVNKNSPNKNFGADQSLKIDGDPKRTSYLKFDLRDIATPVERAILKLFITDSSGAEQTLSLASTDWNELEANWNNRPEKQGEILKFTSPNINSWIELDVTNQARTAQEGFLSVAIEQQGGNQVFYNSKEAASNKPSLVMNFLDVIVASPTPTPTPGTGNEILCDADINEDNFIDLLDAIILIDNFYNVQSQSATNTISNPRADINADSIVDMYDFDLLAKNLFRSCEPTL